MAKFIDQEDVTRYVELDARIKKLEAEKEVLREELIAAFERGLQCPRKGPWLIELTYQNRKQISWKDEFLKLAKDSLGKTWRKYVLRIENEAPVVKTPMIPSPKPNPDYEQEVAS